ncbi:MAG: GNAT family N-acetyltransferase [Pseudomonadota bacterium]
MQIINIKKDPSHIKQVAEWQYKEWAYLCPGAGMEKFVERIESSLSEDLIPSTFLAIEGHQLMGAAEIVAHDMDTHLNLGPWLASVYVAPEYRCKGVGRSLVKHVMQKAKEHNVETLYLFTPNNEAFYQNLGWNTLFKDEYYGQVVTLMQIELSAI